MNNRTRKQSSALHTHIKRCIELQKTCTGAECCHWEIIKSWWQLAECSDSPQNLNFSVSQWYLDITVLFFCAFRYVVICCFYPAILSLKVNDRCVWVFINKGARIHFWVTSALTELACLSLEGSPDDWLSGALTARLCLEIYWVCFVFLLRRVEQHENSSLFFGGGGIRINNQKECGAKLWSELAVPKMKKGDC